MQQQSCPGLRLLAILALALAAMSPAAGDSAVETAAARPRYGRLPRAAVLVLPANHAVEPALQELLGQIAAAELARRGLAVQSLTAPQWIEMERDQGLPRLRPEDGFALCRRLDLRILLTGVYAVRGHEIHIDLSGYDLPKARVYRCEDIRSAIVLDLDAAVARAVGLLLSEAGFPRDPAPVLAAVRLPPGPPAAVSVPPDPLFQERPFELTLEYAWFGVLGAAGEYLAPGSMPRLSASRRFLAGPGAVGIGCTLGAARFLARGASSIGEAMLLPLGVELIYEPVLSWAFQPRVRLGGGPAVLTLNPDRAGIRAKLIPYLSAGLGLSLPVGSSWGLLIDLGYTAAFENMHPILGLTPSIGGVMRL